MSKKRDKTYIDQIFKKALELSQSDEFKKNIKDKIDFAMGLYSKYSNKEKDQVSHILEQASTLANSKEFKAQIQHKMELVEKLYLLTLGDKDQLSQTIDEAIDLAGRGEFEDIDSNGEVANDQVS
jgi:hypothetical protein